MSSNNMIEKMVDEIVKNDELTSLMFDVNLANITLRITSLEQWVMYVGYKPTKPQMEIVRTLHNQLNNILNTEITPTAEGLK